MTAPLMPKATAVWLVENTTLTFKQIGDFCELHELEVQAIADGDVAFNIVGLNPVTGGQLTADEIARCEQDPSASLVGVEPERNVKAENSKNKKSAFAVAAQRQAGGYSVDFAQLSGNYRFPDMQADRYHQADHCFSAGRHAPRHGQPAAEESGCCRFVQGKGPGRSNCRFQKNGPN